MSERWPTPLKKLREKFPNEALVQVRITFAKGESISYDGKATDAFRDAILDVILHGVEPSERERLRTAIIEMSQNGRAE